MECNDGQDCVNNEYDDGGEEFIEESALSSKKQKIQLIKREFRKQDGAGPNSKFHAELSSFLLVDKSISI